MSFGFKAIASLKRFFVHNYIILVIFLLSIFFIFQITSSIQESQTTDEGVHLAAGYSYLITGDFRMNTEHPPLLKELSALPLLLVKDKIVSPESLPSWENYHQWLFAREFIYNDNNQISVDLILLLGRLPQMLLGIPLGLYIFKWSKELFGIKAGFLSLIFYVFSPNIIAHSRYVTTDLGLTTFFFITIYYFYKYLKGGKIRFLYFTAIFFGLSQISKFSALALIPILLFMYLINYFINQNNKKELYGLKRFLKSFFIIFSITIILIFSSYFFELKKPLEDKNVSDLYERRTEIIENGTIDDQKSLTKKIIGLTDLQKRSGQIINNFGKNVSIPAFSYLNGLTKLFSHNYNGHLSYLNRNYSNSGWWYYFPSAFVVKTPISTLLLLLCLVSISVYCLFKYQFQSNKGNFINKFKSLRNKIPYYMYFLIIPPLFFFIWNMTGHINIGLRHVLVIYPFIFVLFGYLIIFNFGISKILKYSILFIIILIYIISSLMIYPHYLAYFNEIAGGPNKGPNYLVDSNIDWGQDVRKLKKYMLQNNIDHVCMSYFGAADLNYYKIDFRYLPDTNNYKSVQYIDCVIAISVTSLYSQAREYGWLLDFEPTKKIGYSIYVYDFRK